MGKIFTYRELRDWKPPIVPSIIGNGILITGGRLIVYGKAKSWKSIHAMHLGLCISTGTPWFGYPTQKCKVHILQSEIPMAMWKFRLDKYADGNGMHDKLYSLPGQPLTVEYDSYIKLDTGYGINAVEKSLLSTGAQVLIIDPLYKAISGHITDTYDVSKLTDNLDILRDRIPNLSIIIVHHTRKTSTTPTGEAIDMESEEMIGSSYIANWCDSAVSLKVDSACEQGENFTMKFTCMRHMVSFLRPIEGTVNRADLKITYNRQLLQSSELPQEY